MKLPPSTYQKLFDSTLLSDFHEIKHIFVGTDWVLGTVLNVDVYLKPANGQKGMISSRRLLENIQKRIIELNRYLGGRGIIDLDIYFERELLAHNVFHL